MILPTAYRSPYSFASGATRRSTAIGTSHGILDFFPRQPRSGSLQQVRFSSSQLVSLPGMHRNSVRGASQIIPKVFHQLQFFGRCKVKDRIQGTSSKLPGNKSSISQYSFYTRLADRSNAGIKPFPLKLAFLVHFQQVARAKPPLTAPPLRTIICGFA